MSYSVVFSSPSAPALTYFNGAIHCGGGSSAFSLPVNGGAGAVSGAPVAYSGAVSCAAATPSTLSCNAFDLSLGGPGVPTTVATIFSQPTALPISLIRFDARKDRSQVHLLWEAARGANGGSLQLEQSTNASEWTLCNIPVTQTSTAASEIFEAHDALPQAGLRYYRLRYSESDGSFSYSNTLAVRGNNDLSLVSIVPNPVAEGRLRIEGLENAADWDMSVLNMASQRVLHKAVGAAEIQLPELTPGLYILQLSNRESGDSKALRFRKD